MTTGPELADSRHVSRLARAYRPLLARLATLGPGFATAGWGLVLGHTALLGDVAPFGLAYAAAVRRVDPARAAWAAVGALAGTALRAPAEAPVAGVLLFLVILAMGALDAAPAQVGRVGALAVGVACGLATMVSAAGLSAVPVAALVAAAMGGLLFVPFMDGARVAAGHPSARLTLDGAESVGFLLLLSCALATVAPYAPLGVPVAAFVLPLSAQGAARVAGAAAGAVAGLAIGALFVLGGHTTPALVLMAAAGSVLAAWGRRYGTAWGLLGAVAGGVVFARTLGPSVEALAAGLGAYLAATIVAWASPAALWEVAASYVGLVPPRPDRALRRRLRAISRVMEMLSTAMVEPAATARATEAEQVHSAQAERLVQGVTRRACVGCGQYGQCWHHDVHATYGRLQTVLAQLDRAETEGQVEESLRTWCLRPRPVAIALGYVHDLHEVESRLVRRWRATRSALSEPLRGVSEALGNVDETPQPSPPDQLPFAWGLAARPRGGTGGGRVSGDACLVRPLPGGRLLVVLSDGMGAGSAAAVESEPTVHLADRLLESGFAVRTAAQTVNSLMVLEGSEDTFTTLDLAVVHLGTGEAEFVKIGAPPTMVIRRGRLERVEVHAPPAGILREVRVDVRRRHLAGGDWLVAMTDGAYDPLSRDEDWVDGFLRAIGRARGPQWVADQLLRRACELGGEGMDDATVAVVRLGPGPGAEV